MKNLTFILAILMATTWVSAQTADSIPHHNLGHFGTQPTIFMEMRDGGLVDGVVLYAPSAYPNDTIVGHVLHKVMQQESSINITDTLFTSLENPTSFLVAKDLDSNDNILAALYNDHHNGGCFLKIQHFNDDLNFDTTEILVPLSQSFRNCSHPGPQLDPNGDIVLAHYGFNSMDATFARIGLDGTVKFQKSIDTLKINQGYLAGPVIFRNSPLTYCCWGNYIDPHTSNPTCVNCYLLDSKFDVTNFYTFPRESGSPDFVDYWNDGFHTSLLGLDDDCFLVARTYTRDPWHLPVIEDDGVAVMKYDSNFNQLVRRKFLSEYYYPYSAFGATAIGLEKSRDGYVYFAYFTHNLYSNSRLCVVKMDYDLNIVWQRYCLDLQKNRNSHGKMVVLHDNSVALMGVNYCYDPITQDFDYSETFYVIVHDDYDGLEEQGILVRPYAYYPNPTKDVLHLQYSPDVTPKQIELYDLQGRLVRSQRNCLESLDMEGLASGTYTLRVTLEGGQTFSDKVVKE